MRYTVLEYTCYIHIGAILKVRGPFVETFCIEKDPYMNAI